MATRFLSLATQGGTSQPNLVMFGPMIVLLLIVLVVLAICATVLIHFARRRLIDNPPSHKQADLVDPWAEAGRRIGGTSKTARPTTPPIADHDDHESDENGDEEKAS